MPYGPYGQDWLFPQRRAAAIGLGSARVSDFFFAAATIIA